MRASTYFTITRAPNDDWFDAIINADTQLFIDPFLIFKDNDARWHGAHDALVEHFNRVFLLIAQSNFNQASISYRKALDLLVFSEPKELCIGYTFKGTAGAGSGRGFARIIAKAIEAAIQRGLRHPRHFEELGILHAGIGSDRISDITATILKPRLVEYTRTIAARHNIPVQTHRIYAGGFNEQRQRFESQEHEVPTNPFTKGPLLFVPERFLNDLPVLNAEDWWDNWENERLRDDVNYEIMGKVDKGTIVATARDHPDAVRRWTKEMEAKEAQGYDFQRDAKGVVQWDAATEKFTRENPLVVTPPQTQAEFVGIIESVLERFRHFVEDQKGWYLLWDNGARREKQELAVQLLFKGIAASYCRANGISFDPEVNLGQGPVDFKFSNGYQRRAHLEVKKLHSSKFWNGLEQQLPTYMRSDEVADGWFVAVRYREGPKWDSRANELASKVKDVGQKESLKLRYQLIDARPRDPASRSRSRSQNRREAS